MTSRPLAIIAVLLLVGGAIWWWVEARPYSGPHELVRIAAYAGDVGAHAHYALDKGIFDKHGLAVFIDDFNSGKQATEALLRGTVDISTSGISPTVSAILNNEPIKIVASVAASDLSEIIARRNAGINEPADLQGKRIGVLRKSTPEFFLGRFLAIHGLTLSEVELVDIPPNEMQTALAEERIDAAVIWNPIAHSIKQQQGDRVLSWSVQGNQRDHFLMLASEEWLIDNPEAAKRLMHALVEADKRMGRRPEAAQEYIIEKFSLNADYFREIWPRVNLHLALPQSLLIELEDLAQWRIDNGLESRTSVPNMLPFIHAQSLRDADKSRVTIVKQLGP